MTVIPVSRSPAAIAAWIGDAPRQPWIYLIVATGDIHEDIPQARAAARAGADVIAVIRSTGQSLLDYVPEGATREGYAGTYATQENFRLMRAALDDVSKELGRYVRLTNYASGLCMPEIAALAGLERLDMMLNDCMYGIIFRDINPQRTFIDQRFSRMVHARAGIVINTGEDNYLTTADAVDAAHTVVVSQLLNERFAHEAGLVDGQLGLGHAFEINPALPDSLRLELAPAGVHVVGVHVGYVDTAMAEHASGPKMQPADLVAAVLDAVEANEYEVVADEISAQVKAGLSGPVEALYPELAGRL
jgi:beta-lysine 5,6-aminomutase alpha subunit